MLVVLFSGLLCLIALSVVVQVSAQAVWLSVTDVDDSSGTLVNKNNIDGWATFLVGVLFAVATYTLYRAFGSGPVRLVAPIIGAFPIATMGISAIRGEPVTVYQWVAVLLVIAGIALVSVQRGIKETTYNRTKAIVWSVLSASAFAGTFMLGQFLSETQNPWATFLLTRSAAVVCVVLFMILSGGLRIPAIEHWGTLALMGLLDAAALSLVLIAGRLPGAALATVTTSLFGMITVLLAWVFLKERMGNIQWAGVIVAFAAIGFLASA